MASEYFRQEIMEDWTWMVVMEKQRAEQPGEIGKKRNWEDWK